MLHKMEDYNTIYLGSYEYTFVPGCEKLSSRISTLFRKKLSTRYNIAGCEGAEERGRVRRETVLKTYSIIYARIRGTYIRNTLMYNNVFDVINQNEYFFTSLGTCFSLKS